MLGALGALGCLGLSNGTWAMGLRRSTGIAVPKINLSHVQPLGAAEGGAQTSTESQAFKE